MKSGNWKIEDKKRDSMREASKFRSQILTTCPACGADATREEARYCLVCGKILSEGYQPLDAIRSSHRLQGKAFLLENEDKAEITDLFAREENGISETAWACFVYSMVPYLGIVFIPLTFLVGGAGIAASYKNPRIGGRKLATLSIVLSIIVLAIQILLWWLLYVVPGLNR